MRWMMLVGIALLAAFACEQPQPTFSGGKPIEHWLKAVESRDPKTRRAAVRKLSNVGTEHPAAFPAVFKALRDSDIGVRQEAIVGMLKFEAQACEAAPVLKKLEKEDKDLRVRECARKALDTIEQKAQ